MEFYDTKEAEADLQELELLLEQAKRPKSKAMIQAEIVRIKASLPADGAQTAASAEQAQPAPQPAPEAQSKPVLLSRAAPAAADSGMQYQPIDKFAWDQGEYNTPWLTIYVSGLDGVGEVKEGVTCDFGLRSFDLKIHGLGGKNYRMVKDRLDEEINPDKSKIIVKKNEVRVKLHKTKGEESYSSYKTWMNLESKKTKEQEQKTKDDPTAGIMDLMKDMYDSGDDNMRKAIGEAMMKSKSQNGMDGLDDQ